MGLRRAGMKLAYTGHPNKRLLDSSARGINNKGIAQAV